MGEIKYTEDQLKVINLRDSNILVSAAAGSGKTTVLVERIIRRVIEDGLDIDSMLVLTFTNAAAADMKAKIEEALSKALEKDPDNEHLRKQVSLIHNAQITTIHSFCLYLIKNNFAFVGIEPGFRIADEHEIAMISEEALDDTIEEMLTDSNDRILAFMDRFTAKDNLRVVRDIIITAVTNAENAPFPEDYIAERRRDYEMFTPEELDAAPWMQDLLQHAHRRLEHAGSLVVANERFAMDNEIGAYMNNAHEDRKLFEALLECKTYADYREKLQTSSLTRLGVSKGDDPLVKEVFRNNRTVYKKVLDKLKADFFPYSLEEMLPGIRANHEIINGLWDAVLIYMRHMDSEKRARNMITFSDMEHLALKILLNKEGDTYVPSAVAREYRNDYKEIMIDEYQDSNYIQEWILKSLSGEDEGVYNRFMVGDVKQSIYRFRNAEPQLFADKYNTYSPLEGSACRRIDLNRNYRSRAEVIDSVNEVFGKIMSPELGGISYDEGAALKLGADYPPKEGGDKTEFLLAVNDGDITDHEREAGMIAGRIKELVGRYQVMDKDTKGLRPCQYRDIVILLRSAAGYADAFKTVLNREGVPAYVAAGEGYFDRSEVKILLDYLAILNNPRNDIALCSVLKSVFADMTDSDLAMLKAVERWGACDEDGKRHKEKLIEVIKLVHEKGEELLPAILERVEPEDKDSIEELFRDLLRKTDRFLTAFLELRKGIKFKPIHKLLYEILDLTDYVNHVAAMPMGERRKANVMLLLRKAERFEENGFKGLYDFVNYIEKIRKLSLDEGDALTIDENANLVRIMTMHKSKGLEFPICIVAGMSKKFNTMDSKAKSVYHIRYGMGIDYVDPVHRAKYSDLRRKFIADVIRDDNLAEEIRVLYVAFTRAKEKLIITGVINDEAVLEKYADCLQNKPSGEGGGMMVPVTILRSSESFLQMLLQTRGNNDWNGQIELKVQTVEEETAKEAVEVLTAAERKESLIEAIGAQSGENEKLRERLSFSYPHKELEGLFVKTTVSELKMAAIHTGMDEGVVTDVPDDFFKAEDKDADVYVPSFAIDKTEVKGTARGTAYHRVLELMDYTRPIDTFEAQMETLINEGILARDDYELVDLCKIRTFLESDLCRRMSDAAVAGNLYKEQPFVLGIDARRLRTEYPEGENVLIQGIVDVFFIEDGEIVLLDYKTDNVSNEKSLVDRYATQLKYYNEAVSRITGLKVRDNLIWSFKFGCVVDCGKGDMI
ncbi:MAG: helicase-exonuclease AddAB subunit AddA [Lachnospiraceae bacterium]|nr:helicase-exonuclease AddAB subunit AddA [Lachnospiraceae bacterium]